MLDSDVASPLVSNFFKIVVFDLGDDKAPSPDGFPLDFFCRSSRKILKMREFHARGKLSRHLRASFNTLIAKKSGAVCIKDFHPISLIGFISKILAKVLASRLQKVLPNLISLAQGAFAHKRQVFDGILVANKCIHSRNLDKKAGLICELDLDNGK